MIRITQKWLEKHNASISKKEMKQAEEIGDVFEIIKKLKELKREEEIFWLFNHLFTKKDYVRHNLYGYKLLRKEMKNPFLQKFVFNSIIEAAEKYLKKQSKKNRVYFETVLELKSGMITESIQYEYLKNGEILTKMIDYGINLLKKREKNV